MEPPSAGQGVGAGGAYNAPGSGGSGTEGASSPSSQLLLLLQLLSEGAVEWVAGGPGDRGAPKNSLESCSGSQLYQRWGSLHPPNPSRPNLPMRLEWQEGAPSSKQTLNGELGEVPWAGTPEGFLPGLSKTSTGGQRAPLFLAWTFVWSPTTSFLVTPSRSAL